MAASALALAATIALARAEPLAKEACDASKTEQDKLVAGGIKDDIARGPDWAKGNLKPDRLNQIQRYIELEEQLSFRCGLASVKLMLPEPPAEATQPAAEAAPKPKAKPKPRAAAVPDPPAAPAASEPGKSPQPATDAAAAKPQPKAQAKPKAAAKPKADDAYRPPQQADPGADPFARQVAPKQ